MWRAELSSRIKSDRTVDCTGLYCPEPVFRTRIALDEMEKGEILEVIADDPAAEEDIKNLVKHLGHSILELRKEGKTLYILIRKEK